MAPLAPPGRSVVSISPVSRLMSSRSPCAVSPTSSIPDGVGNIGPPSSSTSSGGRVVVGARGRVVVGAGRVVSTASCSGTVSADLVERRRRSTGRQITAGLGDHPDDADDDGHAGTDAQATSLSAVEWWTPGRLRHRRFERDMPLSCRLLNELDLDPLAHSPTITPQRRPAVGSEPPREEASPGASATLVVERTHGELAGTAG